MQIDTITCNTPDDVLFRNIEQNAARDLPWITEVPPHDGHAVLVGGGPSLLSQLDEIRWRHNQGQFIFALNNAALALTANGIWPDYQIILDARPHNAKFVPNAGLLLLASQCDQSVFNKGHPERIRVWHAKIDGIVDHLPYRDNQLTLIGGGTTVGLSAMALVYTMGYRKLHLFGYDSSYADGQSHAYEQPENSYEPRCKVTVHGRTFDTSLAMAWQAELFPILANSLIDRGCVITVDGDGLLPFMVRNAAPAVEMTEQAKYEEMWTRPEYRAVAPGEYRVAEFVSRLAIGHEHSVIDFGAGTGRAALNIAKLGASVTLVDFASNSRDAAARHLPFVQADLSEPIYLNADIGYCTDVMEHIPPEQVDAVLQNIMRCVPQCFFAIDYEPDNCGALIGQTLHLSVHPHQWWLDTFMRLGMGVEWATSDGGSGCFHVIRSAVETIPAAYAVNPAAKAAE